MEDRPILPEAEESLLSAGTLIHIPTPGDHYSAVHGGAVMTVIYELNRAHAAAGGESWVVVTPNARHDYPVGQLRMADFVPLPSGKQKAIEAVAGGLHFRRRFTEATYRPLADAIPRETRATILLHNAPGAARLFRERAPEARLVLYAHNELFRTFTVADARRTIGLSNRVVCVSEWLANQLTARVGDCDGRIAGLLNGVDTERFSPPLPPRSSGEPPTILFLGRVIPAKGPDLLLKAGRILADAGCSFKIRIVGSAGFTADAELSPYEQGLRTLAASLGDRVEFQPYTDRNSIPAAYRDADIMVVPSNWDEPCALTVSEAMATGLPVVASSRGGIPENGGEGAQYFPSSDHEALANRLRPLIERPDEREKWGARARARAAEIAWDRQYARLRDLIFA